MKELHRVPLAGAAIGCRDDPPSPKIWTSVEQDAEASAFFDHLSKPHAQTVCIGPTANWQGKIWPIKHFVGLAERLFAPGAVFENFSLAVVGGPDEREQAAPLLSVLPPDRLVDLIGTPLGVAAAAIKQCAFYIGNDSGLMHMAAAVGTPTLGLFGPSRDWLYYPWGPHCAHIRTPESFSELTSQPGYDRHTTGSLMTTLTVEMVERAVIDLWKTVKAEAEIEDKSAG